MSSIKIITNLIVILVVTVTFPSVHAATIVNPGFEEGWDGWTEIDKDNKSASISGEQREGEKSAKITSPAATFAQIIRVQANTDYVLGAYVKGTGIIGVKMGDQVLFERQSHTRSWQQLQVGFNSGTHRQIAIFAQHNGKKSLFDDFSITQTKGQQAESIRVRQGGLSPDLPPGSNFELIDWYLNTPASSADGRSLRISERDLVAGYEDEDYFYTGDDGGMVFKATIGGMKTSKNTRYTRTELREMLRRGDSRISTREEMAPNKNNWVFSSAPAKTQKASGGVDGTLRATLAVNYVTTTGDTNDIGTVIIGQIHAGRDEPARLYYRKLPGNDRGSVYVAHEKADGEDLYFDILGNRSSKATNPLDGIALNDKFSYEIAANGNELQVSITQKGVLLGRVQIDMTGSGYDVQNDYMYFKAGVYNQNDSGDPADYVQATFYLLENQHKGYRY